MYTKSYKRRRKNEWKNTSENNSEDVIIKEWGLVESNIPEKASYSLSIIEKVSRF